MAGIDQIFNNQIILTRYFFRFNILHVHTCKANARCVHIRRHLRELVRKRDILGFVFRLSLIPYLENCLVQILEEHERTIRDHHQNQTLSFVIIPYLLSQLLAPRLDLSVREKYVAKIALVVL